MPDGIGPANVAVGSQCGAFAGIDSHFCARPKRTPAGVWGEREISERSVLARFDFILRIFSRRYGRGARREPSDGMDGAGVEAARTDWRVDGYGVEGFRSNSEGAREPSALSGWTLISRPHTRGVAPGWFPSAPLARGFSVTLA